MLKTTTTIDSLPKKVHTYEVFKSVRYAISGLISGFQREPNLLLQFTIGMISIGFSVLFQLYEFGLTHLVLMSITLGMELMNTAFENLCDLVNPSYHEKVKSIKDIAAGAVLAIALGWLAVIAVEIGYIIFTFF
jgi:diacylglycerol kinase